MAGFGSLPGAAGVPEPQDPANQADQVADDIHSIRVKYVDGQTNFKQPLNLAANAGVRVDMQGQKVNAILLTVATGVIFGYLTDQSPQFGAPAFLPDFCVSAGVVPTTVEIVIPPREDYTLSFQEGAGGTATGVARAMHI